MSQSSDWVVASSISRVAAEPNLEADPGSCLAPTPALAPPQNPVTDEALLGQCLIATHNKTAQTAMSVHLSFT